VQHTRPAAHPAIDCFYIFPTVSLQSTTNANLVIDPQETAVSIDQAASPMTTTDGGSCSLKRGGRTGGDFSRIPACHAATQTGCVVAYSTFEGTPPANRLFGRVGSPITYAQRETDLQVLCVRPGRAHRRPRDPAPRLPQQHDRRDESPGRTGGSPRRCEPRLGTLSGWCTCSLRPTPVATRDAPWAWGLNHLYVGFGPERQWPGQPLSAPRARTASSSSNRPSGVSIASPSSSRSLPIR
jgi:hypothetical protein